MKIAIVCPVFREAEAVGLFHARLRTALEQLSPKCEFEVLYVVDPGGDATESSLEKIATDDRAVRVLVMSRRFGHQAALIAGLDHAQGDAVIMMDSDGQHPPELLQDLLLAFQRGADIVQTLREDGRDVGFLKRITSQWFYRVMGSIADVRIQPGAADYRLLSRRVVEVFRNELRERNVFLRGLIAWVGFNVAFVPYRTEARIAGRSKYRPTVLFDFALRGISAFSKAPLRVAIAIGMVLSLASMLAGALQVTAYFLAGPVVPGWASLMTFVSFVSGVQLLFLGLLGEYIGQVFDEVKQRPRYLIARSFGSGSPQTGGSERQDD